MTNIFYNFYPFPNFDDEPVSLKNQGLAKNFANPVQIGCFTWIRTKINGVRVRCPTIRR